MNWFQRLVWRLLGKLIPPVYAQETEFEARDACMKLIAQHWKYAAPFEVMELKYYNVKREGETIGSYRVTVERHYGEVGE